MNILDASSLLAYLKEEKGAERIKKLMADALAKKDSLFIHECNFTEVIYKCLRLLGEEKTKKIIADLDSPFLGIINYMDKNIGLYSATLKSQYTLSLGDAIGLACAKVLKGTFWTADRALKEIAEKEQIPLQLIR